MDDAGAVLECVARVEGVGADVGWVERIFDEAFHGDDGCAGLGGKYTRGWARDAPLKAEVDT